MKLPGRDQAVVDVAKLRDYCFSTGHVRGRHKARLFASVLGITSADADFVRVALLLAAEEGDAIAGEIDEYGARYTIDFELVHGDRRAAIRSA
jgi:hypothetical protein